jgi:hypothetical protein
MDGNELRIRIRALGLSYRDAAPQLGLSVSGLHHQLRGEAKVSRRSEMFLARLERRQHTVIVAAGGGAVRLRRIPPPPLPEIITSADLQAHDVHYAIQGLDEFVKRHNRIGREIEEFARPLRLRLLQRLERTELVQLANRRQQQRPKLKAVDPDD